MNSDSSRAKFSSLTKSEQRRQAKEILAALVDKPALDQKLCEQLIRFFQTRSGKWTCFRGLPTEPDLLEVTLQCRHIQWVWPVMVGSELRFRSLLEQAPQWVQGPHKVWEPVVGGPEWDVNSLDGFLVPGLAFDRHGGRLGRGRGFYDRALSTSSAPKWGVAYDRQVVPNVVMEAHDVKMTGLITESGAKERL